MDSDETYSTTVHETAHYTHYRNLISIGFYAMNSMIRESWATAVELYLTKKEYQAWGVVNYGEFNYDLVPPTFFPTYKGYQLGKGNESYTPLFIDLIDNYNQKEQISSTQFLLINDIITGYNMPALEVYLGRIHNEGDLRKELKNHKPANVTDVQIDDFLSQYKF